MGSEVLLRGEVSVWTGVVDTARPDGPNVAPAAAWVQMGDSYWSDDGITLMVEQTIEKDYILNEAEAVDAFRTAMMKSIGGNLKNLTAEALSHALNRNAITTTSPTATEVGFREIDLDIGTLVRTFAALCRVDASPYDEANVRTAGFRTEVWFPRAFETANFESVLSPKASSMFPFTFEGLKSPTPNVGSLRITDLPTS